LMRLKSGISYSRVERRAKGFSFSNVMSKSIVAEKEALGNWF
jgi:hypothetical protein